MANKNFEIKNGLDVGNGLINAAAGDVSIRRGMSTTNRIRIASANIYADTNLTVAGNLTVQGDTTTLNVGTLDVEDKNITLNKGSGDTSGSANGAGITIQDAVDASTDATFLWNSATDQFELSHDLRIDNNRNILLERGGELRSLDTSSATKTIARVNGSNELEYGWSSSGPVKFMGGGSYNERMRVHTDGNIGIGSNSPVAKLHIQDNDSTVYDATAYQHDLFIEKRNSAGNNQVGTIRFAITGHDGSTTAEASIGVLQTSNAHSGNIVFGTRHSGTRAERMRISSDGKVGIGQTNPYYKFNVYGANITYGSAGTNGLFFDTSSATTGTGGGIALGGYTNGTSGDVYHFGNIQGIKENSTAGNSDSAMLFSTKANGAAPTEKMRIDSAGRVGIGSSQPSGYHAKGDNLVIATPGVGDTGMTIVSSSSATGRIFFADGTSGGAESAGQIKYDHGSNFMSLHTSDNERLRIDAEGALNFSNSSVSFNSNNKTFAHTNNFQYFIGGSNGLYLADNYNLSNAIGIRDANYIDFSTNGSESMRIDANGHVGIGRTPESDYYSGIKVLTLGNGPAIYASTSGNPNLTFNDNLFINSAGNNEYQTSNPGTRLEQFNGTLTFSNAPSGTAGAQATLTERFRIAADGKVGIGTNSPDDKLDIMGGGYDQIRIGSNKTDNTNKTSGIVSTMYTNNTVSIFQGFFQNGNNSLYYGSADGAHRGLNNHYFYTNSNYNATTGHKLRYHIAGSGKHTFYGKHQGDSVGHFLFTNNSSEDAAGTNCSLAVQNGYTFLQFMAWTSLGARIGTRTGGWNATGSQATYLVSGDTTFAYGSGSNFYLGSGTAITSDKRLKKNIVSTPDGQLAKINALRPVSFDWKDTRKDSGEGFIAQEVEAIIPEAVAESEYAPDPDDDTRDFDGDVKSIRDGVLLSRLVKAVQELSAKLEAAEARIKTLEG